VALAWGTVRNLDALTSTTYGRTLLVKVAIVALVGAAAIYNKRWLVPAVRAGGEEGDHARSALGRTVRLEVVGMLAAVVVTAALVNIEPARLAASPGIFEQTVAFGDGSAVIQVDPAEAGDNSVHVYLLTETGGQLELDEPPVFRFTLAAMDIGPIEREPFRAGPGHYTIDGRELAIAGTWTVEVRGRISQFEEAVATVQVPVR
jgi:copper transport protein